MGAHLAGQAEQELGKAGQAATVQNRLSRKETTVTSTERSAFEEELRARMAAVVWQKGVLVAPDANFYGWRDYSDVSSHNRECELGTFADVTETTWDEFVDTFVDTSTTHYGIEITATCTCGAIQDRRVRLEERFGKLLNYLLRVNILDKTKEQDDYHD